MAGGQQQRKNADDTDKLQHHGLAFRLSVHCPAFIQVQCLHLMQKLDLDELCALNNAKQRFQDPRLNPDYA